MAFETPNDCQQFIRAFLEQLATDPLAAAARMEIIADQLRARAQSIRQQHQANPLTTPSSIGDFVTMEVRGPDGKLKQRISTGDRGS